GVLHDVVSSTAEEERLLRVLIELALGESLERRNRLLELHILPFHSGELLGDCERLGHETLDAARAADDALVFFGQLVHAEDRDDVLQLLVPLQNPLDFRRYLIVSGSDEPRDGNS